MATKKTVFFLLLISSPVTITTKKVGASHEEKKVADMINKQNVDIKKRQEEVNKLLDKIAAAIELSCADYFPLNWIKHGKSYYYIDDTPIKKWSDARLKCQTIGADLVIIRSQEENQFISDMIDNRNIAGTVGAWIGLQRKADDMFYWVDGSPVQAGQYQNWENGEPNNHRGNEDCVYMHRGEGAEWNDDPCDLTAYSYWRMNTLATLCQKMI